jgi:ubiquinone/menaquinone biosynthesis C-methylase UbiE
MSVDPNTIANIAQHSLRVYYDHKLLRDILYGVRLGRVLDFGCGYGRLTCVLSEFADEVIGIDVNKTMIEMAKDSYRDWKNIAFYSYDGVKIPAPDKLFELTMTFTVLQHLADEHVKQLMPEIKRVTSAYILLVEETVPLGMTHDRPVKQYEESLSPGFRLVTTYPRFVGATFDRPISGTAMFFKSGD